jgi:RHS repeat-associated protein
MTHFRQSTRSQLLAYQYAYGDKTASGVCLQTITDYSPFGVALDGRTMQGEEYRYGFNGMEKDDEVKGEGNSYTTEFRQYDPRIGRWMSIDPKFMKAPNLTPYRFSFNNPIAITDPNGDYEVDGKVKGGEKSEIKSKHKNSGEKNWRSNYKSELKAKELENIKKIESWVDNAKQLLMEDDKKNAQELFKQMTGSSLNFENPNKVDQLLFVNNGKGPKISMFDIGDNKSGGRTLPTGKIFLNRNFSEYGISRTILHEYIHYAQFKLGIKGDLSTNGYSNLSLNGTMITSEMQIEALENCSNFYNEEAKKGMLDNYYYGENPKNLDEKTKMKLVEGGYVFDYFGFGNTYVRPERAKINE